jgi:uncharacterized protein YutE (UPF0331/DUF86 family)
VSSDPPRQGGAPLDGINPRCGFHALLPKAHGFRSVVAHGYAGIDVAATHAASTVGVDDFDRFAREVATWLVNRATPDDERH